MVTANESWSSKHRWNSHSLNNVPPPLQPGQQSSLPSLPNYCVFTTNVAFPGSSVSGFPRLGADQPNGIDWSFQCLPRHLESSSPQIIACRKESELFFCPGIGINAAPNVASDSAKKTFLIFDQSGDETRLFYSPMMLPLQKEKIGSKTPLGDFSLHHRKQAEEMSSMKTIIEENLDERYSGDSGSTMYEDTEEINALLYSDDDDNDDYDDDDDEVTSTDRSPFITGLSCIKQADIEELTEEVLSSEGSSKRQKLLDGRYTESSLVDNSLVKFARSCNYDDDVESSYADGRMHDKDIKSNLDITQRKVKISETLKILESIIPGLNSEDPVLIIQAAIDYLKALKFEAKALGGSYTQGQCVFPQ